MRLESSAASLEVDLDRGGRLASMVVDGLELLVPPADDPLAWGAYVLAPWAGRVRDGRFVFDDAEHRLATRGAHALHGTVVDRPWRQVDEATVATELGPGWPWPGRVEQRLTLTQSDLTLELAVHADAEPMPVIAGWHPWFRRRLERGAELELDLEPVAAWEVDDERVPTGRLVPPPPPPWDTPFAELRRPAVLRWPGALELELTGDAACWVVYTEPTHAVCVEPQTDRPDALATTAVARPGEPVVTRTVWRWTLPAT